MCKVKVGNEYKNNKLMSFRINDKKLFGKYKLFGIRLKT